MRSLGLFSLALLSTLTAASRSQQRPRGQDCAASADGGLANSLTIINATPYSFHRSAVHSCQVGSWTLQDTPAVIEAGKSATFSYRITRGGDAAADLSYLLNIDGKMSKKQFNIHVQGRDRLVGYVISAEVSGGLTTAGHGSDQGRFQFGDIKDAFPQSGYPDVFVLSGNETYGYGTVEPPVAWMSAMGPVLKKLSLRNLVIPASHDSGMSQTVDGIGVDANTRTQDTNIYGQLVRGIRMLDFRPHLGPNDDDFRLAHFTKSFGAFGESLVDAMSDIKRFRREYPGELIVIDILPGLTRLKGPTSTPFTEKQCNDLLDTLEKGLPSLKTEYELSIAPTDATGLTAEPIDTFYKKEPSPILLRVPVDRKEWLGRQPVANGRKTTGTVASTFLPVTSKWSDTNGATVMSKDQKSFFDSKYTRNAPFMSVFVLTLQGLENIPLGDSIRSLAFEAKKVLYTSAWDWSSVQRYPNMLQFDYVLDKQVAAVAAAMNYQFAFARLWTGK
ncbi:hypothetical protein AMS68_007614 [Peltaster fructicola]|uniref:Phosphatidylinositol-specific phospholipase C X domain-containing protein n=1 Tax=Peltaster fructicola TaxID=286661 RepID=A0A6H0Y4Y0_9PEZI|nr:hypothetical protein AMS68_007614 [Peltaster fructicola]